MKWIQGVDATFVGIEKANPSTKFDALCPYAMFDLQLALNHQATKKRIAIIDSAILKACNFKNEV